MVRKWMGLMLALEMVLATAGTARARTGDLRVIPMWCGEPAAGGQVTVCRIGAQSGDNVLVTDGLANWTLEEKDILDAWQPWILENSAGEEQTATVQPETGAEFLGLEEGVYLVRQTEETESYSSFTPFLLRVPEGEDWTIIRRPMLLNQGEAPRTGDHPAPIIAAMGIGFSVAALMVLVDNRKK